MTKQTQLEPPADLQNSLIVHEQQANKSLGYKILTKIDFFSFLPVPKDELVSTKASMIGSVLFLILFFSYIGFSFYTFIVDNPPSIQTYNTQLDDSITYQLPRISVAFMAGQTLNQTDQYLKYFNFTFTKERKAPTSENKTMVNLTINDPQNTKWLTNQTVSTYTILRSPSQPMMANGLLYSSPTCNYTKLLIKLCQNNSASQIQCDSITNITSLTAKGRVFLFIEQIPDTSSVSKQKKGKANKYRLANFFLQPFLYKRATVLFKVIKTKISPDYFKRFRDEENQRLTLQFVTQQSSNTSINSYEFNVTPTEMLGIVFQLSSQVQMINIIYPTILDYVSKWGAFFNVLFVFFALFLVNYNRRKFYKKNPQWDKFKEVTTGKYKVQDERSIIT